MHDDTELLRLTRRLWLQRENRVQPLRWQPAADVYRHRGGWLLKIELAGVAPDQVELDTHGRHLRIRGRRRDITAQRHYACHTLEIAYSAFERVFELPFDLGHARIATRFQDGMLLVDVTMESERT
jgi:HSP20 family protein